MRALTRVTIMICLLCIAQGAWAQLSRVAMDIEGKRPRFGVSIDGVGEVIIDCYGQIIRVRTSDKYRQSTVGYDYYSNFNSYEAGKIKSIAGVIFTYYSNFNDYEAGKIKSIAGTNIKYHSNFNDYEAGKLKSVASVGITYYSNFNSYEAGKVKSIGSHRYDYFSNFGDSNLAGQPKSGYANVSVDGINFILRASYK